MKAEKYYLEFLSLAENASELNTFPFLYHSQGKKKKAKDPLDHQTHAVFHTVNPYSSTGEFLQNPKDYDGAYDYYMTVFSVDSTLLASI